MARHTAIRRDKRSNAARTLNLLLGAWLFLSAFLLPHAYGSRTNTWAVGLLVLATAAMAFALPELRFINTVLGLWMLVSVFAIPHVSELGRWNNLLVGLAIFALSLVPAARRGPEYRPPRFVEA